MKKLNTGVEITYDKKGNIKTLYSPYYSEPKQNNPVRGLTLSYASYKLKQLLNGK